jgi:hypothetical protein
MDAALLVDAVPDPSIGGWVVRALLTLSAEPTPSGPDAPPPVPLNIALVLDRSGSMAGEPLAAARDAAAGPRAPLAATDLVSVVAYDDEVRTLAEPATGAEQATLTRAIEALEPGGSTNLSGGWLRARDLVDLGRERLDAVRETAPHRGGQRAASERSTKGTRRGRAGRPPHRAPDRRAGQRGITSPEVLVRSAPSPARRGDHDDGRLRAGLRRAPAARDGRRRGRERYYVERLDQAADVFAEEVEGLLSLAAQNVRRGPGGRRRGRSAVPPRLARRADRARRAARARRPVTRASPRRCSSSASCRSGCRIASRQPASAVAELVVRWARRDRGRRHRAQELGVPVVADASGGG